ncbi:MAG: hypothetical protein WC516_07965 [Patescibacteria group bacterium]
MLGIFDRIANKEGKLMDENVYFEAIYDPLKRSVINLSEYTLFCKRPSRKLAELIKDDLIKQGKKSVVTQEGDGWEVWWG